MFYCVSISFSNILEPISSFLQCHTLCSHCYFFLHISEKTNCVKLFFLYYFNCCIHIFKNSNGERISINGYPYHIFIALNILILLKFTMCLKFQLIKQSILLSEANAMWKASFSLACPNTFSDMYRSASCFTSSVSSM